MPRLVACGGRNDAYDDFATEHNHAPAGVYVAMLVDSEDPVADLDRTWDHLRLRDHWARPDGADDEQVLLMTTCMETWILADRKAIRTFFGANLQVNALPPLQEIEERTRHAVQEALVHATRTCKNSYKKGKRSFEILGRVSPEALEERLSHFQRFKTILAQKL
jgi:hypothetical protein